MVKHPGRGALLLVEVDRDSSVPLYIQVANRLRTAILAGRLQAGARLPATRILRRELSVSRNTILQAFEMLAGEGYLVARVGDGTYVAETLPDEVLVAARSRRSDRANAPVRTPGYPFRSLSQRGQAVVNSAFVGPSESPLPFTPDLPDVREFPMRAWLRLMSETTGRLRGNLLSDVSIAGYEPLRRAIAMHLTVSRGVVCDWQQVIVTTGSQQSLDLITRMLLDPGDLVWMEEPGYIGARNALLANRCNVIGVPVDEQGMDIAFGRDKLPTPRLIFLTPSRHYPLGQTMSSARRDAVLAFSKESGAWIIEDDYDCEYRYFGAAVPALQGADSYGRVLYVGTFSKTLLPSFRLGFVIVPEDFVGDFARARAVIDRHAPIMEQMALAEFIESGRFAAHNRRMRELYWSRQRVLREAVGDASDGRVRIPAQATGTNVVLRLARQEWEEAILEQALAAGVTVRPLSRYYKRPIGDPGILIGYGAYTASEIRPAAERLSGVLRGFEVWTDPLELGEFRDGSAVGLQRET